MTPTQTGDKPMVTPELLPCPFCGGEAERFTIGEDEPNNAGGDVITCTKCQASSHVEFGRKENLVDRWNTRAQETLSPEQPIDTIQRLGQEFDGPEASPSLGMGEALAAAYTQGAMDVHTHWQANPGEAPRGDPEFGEAARDYAAAALDPFDSAALSPSPDVGLAEENGRLREAVKQARETIQIERDHLVDCCTVGGDIRTLDAGAKPDVGRMDAALAAIDAALGGDAQ